MGEASLIEFSRTFFTNVVSVTPVPFILFVAVFELTMGLFILNEHQNVKIGLIGTTIFLFLITPFGHIQLPWLGLALIQLHLLRKEFDITFVEIVGTAFRKGKK